MIAYGADATGKTPGSFDLFSPDAAAMLQLLNEFYEAGRLAEREEIAQMFDAEHEKRVDNFAQCAAVAIRARK